ncbi:MAG: hydrogen gas-evolving membrane-bound hydrogenase subunit E [Dethiobacteria bacterium]|jgi:multisubunit Na+/H+ antiporter MnhB subunit
MKSNWRSFVFTIVTVVVVAFIGAILLLSIMEMPVYGELENPTNNYVTGRYVDKGSFESGGSNLVANVVLDYRGYDTLLETTVIFTAVMSIMVLWGVKKSNG